MPDVVQPLRDERANILVEARALNDRITTEKRQATAEERQQLDGMVKRAGDLTEQIKVAESDLERERCLADLESEASAPRSQRASRPTVEPTTGHPAMRSEIHLARAAARSFFLGGTSGLREHLAQTEVRSRIGSLDEVQRRALQVDSLVQGGVLVPPIEMQRDILKFIDDQTYVLQWADVQDVTSAQSLGIVSLDADPSDADWTSELGTGSEDSAMKFGQRELHPRPMAKRLKVSEKLLMIRPDSEQLVLQRLGYKFGVAFENACLTGSGSGRPLGVYTASNQGIPTTRDQECANSTTVVADDFIRAKFKLKGQYWPRARWLMHRDVLLDLALQRDLSGGAGTGQYLWRESVRAGEPDTILGLPVFMSEFSPNTKTTGQYVAILGDWSFYMVARALTTSFKRLNELYAETNQIGFIGRMEADGQPTLAEAWVRLKLA